MNTLIHTHPGDPDFHLFERVPQLVYAPDRLRLKQTEGINKEYLHSCLVLLKNNEPIARLALYNNPFLSYQGRKAACAGNFECIQDTGAAEQLLGHAATLAKKELQAHYLVGPMNGSTWDNYRFSTHHNHPNFFPEPDHHLYYQELFTAAGFQPISRYTSALDTQLHYDHPEILKREHELLDAGVVFRNIDMEHFEKELQKIFQLSLTAFKNNFLYTPIPWETFRLKYLEAAKIMNPEYVIMAEDASGKSIGFIFCMDDLYNKKERSLIVKTVARLNLKEWSGLGNVLGNMVTRRAAQNGYSSMVHAFMIEQATSTKLSNNFRGEIYKNYILYGKSLS